jgi:putative transposase
MYRTNLTETQWQYIKKVLPIRERKRKYDLREVWNGLFYPVKTGCQWRMPPAGFPKWQPVYCYYRKWSELLDFDLLLNELREKVRSKRGQNKEPAAGIMDSRSVRRGNNRSLNGIDGNRKVKGIKRHVAVDRNGFHIAVMVTVANIADCRAAYLLMRTLKELCSGVKIILADGGYRREVTETVRKAFGYAIQAVTGNFKEQGFRPLHKRWIVERTFSRFDNWTTVHFHTESCNRCRVCYGDSVLCMKHGFILLTINLSPPQPVKSNQYDDNDT